MGRFAASMSSTIRWQYDIVGNFEGGFGDVEIGQFPVSVQGEELQDSSGDDGSFSAVQSLRELSSALRTVRKINALLTGSDLLKTDIKAATHFFEHRPALYSSRIPPPVRIVDIRVRKRRL